MYVPKVTKKSGLLIAGLFVSGIMTLEQAQPAFAGRAKDLFYQQLEESSASNTGMSYWIELRRGKRMLKVDSRYAFKSGDRIKFHLTSNVDGHAHVVLLQGTTGSKAVLFPVKGKDASNFIRKGRDMALPSSTFLVFDAKPGKEKLRVAISRKNINTATLLQENPGTQIAMASITNNAAVDPAQGNDQLVVAFPEENKAPAPTVASSDTSASDAIPNAIPNEPDEELSKDLFREDSKPKKPVVHKPSTNSNKPRPHVAHNSKPNSHKPGAHKPPTAVTPPPQTIVVNNNPAEILFAEVVLEHM